MKLQIHMIRMTFQEMQWPSRRLIIHRQDLPLMGEITSAITAISIHCARQQHALHLVYGYLVELNALQSSLHKARKGTQ